MDKQTNLQGRADFANLIRTDSATESEGEEYVPHGKDKLSAGPSAQSPTTTSHEPLDRTNAILSRDPSPLPPPSRFDSSKGLGLPSDSDSSPARPAKKPKKQVTSSSDDSDSEDERRRRVAQLKSGAAGGVARGTRQPIRRGGKRF